MTSEIVLCGSYGYSPASFKNFTTEDKRSKHIPTRYKLGVLLRHLGDTEIEKVFAFALDQRQGHYKNY